MFVQQTRFWLEPRTCFCHETINHQSNLLTCSSPATVARFTKQYAVAEQRMREAAEMLSIHWAPDHPELVMARLLCILISTRADAWKGGYK
jgi:hypothetical protein